MWSAITSLLQIIAGWLGLRNKAADASRQAHDEAMGATKQASADQAAASRATDAEFQAAVDAPRTNAAEIARLTGRGPV